MAGCSGGEDGSASTLATEAPSTGSTAGGEAEPCERQLVVFDVFGVLARIDDDLDSWIGGPESPPPVRTGAADVVGAYHGRGYEVLYLTTAPGALTIGDQQLVPALEGWLGSNGFPLDDRTRIWTWESEAESAGASAVEPMPAVTDELLRAGFGGAQVVAGYTDDADKTAAMLAGGVPRDRMFTLGDGAGSHGSTPVPRGDLRAHLDVAGQAGDACDQAG